MRATGAVVLMLTLSAAAASAQEVVTELYGDFRYSYNRADNGVDSYWASANNASRLGVRGSITGGGLTAFADLQTGVGIDEPDAFSARYYLAGVRGAFGSLVVGRHSPAYKAVAIRLDPFFDTSGIRVNGGVPVTGLFAAGSFGLSPLANGFADRALAYTSPSVHGLSATGAVYIDPQDRHDYTVGLGYLAHGIDAGVHYYEANGPANWTVLAPPVAEVDDALRVHAAYAYAGRGSLGASFERVESVAGDDQDYLYVFGTANVAPATHLAGSFGRVSDSAALQFISGNAFTGGIFHSFFPQARVHALFSWLDVDDGPSRSNASLGLTYQFVLRP